MTSLETAAARSAWSNRDTGEKVLLFGGLLLCVMVLPTFPVAPLVALVVIGIALGPARVPVRLLAVLAAGPLLFVILGVLPLLVTVSGGFGWAPDGPRQAVTVAVRASAAVVCTLSFAATTPMGAVLVWLRRSGTPAAVCHVAAVTYRLIGSLFSSARTMFEAQAARLGHRTRRAMIRDVGGQFAAVFVRAMDSSRRLQEGLALRAEVGDYATLSEERRRDPRFVAGTVLLLVVLVAVGLARWIGGYGAW